jgi:hypothetical protein
MELPMSVPLAFRRAYERGRLRAAAGAALPVLVVPGLVLVVSGAAVGACALAVALVAGFVFARWRGRS